MNQALLVMLFLICVILILAIGFIWVNNRFNNYEEFDDLEDGALVKLEMKNHLLQELHRWIKVNSLDAKQIQEKLMVTPKRSADIIYQRVNKFTVDSLTNLVLRIGKSVTVLIHDK